MSAGIYWGELACLADGFLAESRVGWEPAVARVRVLRSDVLSWALKHDPQRFAKFKATIPPLPQVARALREALPAKFTPISSLPTKADLVVEEVQFPSLPAEAGFDPPGLRMADMFVVDFVVIDREALPDVIELVLVDARWFWRTHGLLRRDFNVPRGRAADGTLLYQQRTLRGGLRTHTAREILQDCLDALPGGGRVAAFPAFRERVLTVFGAGAAPQATAEEVANRLDLVYARNLDGTASFYVPGTGGVGETPNGVGGDNTNAHDFATGRGVWGTLTLGGLAVPDETNFYAQRVALDAPDAVAIVCPPPVWTAQVDLLEPWVVLEQVNSDGGGPRRVELEVVPDLLKNMGLQPRTDGGLGDGREPWRLLKIPTMGGAWRSDFGSVPADLGEKLAGELFLRFKLPAAYTHLGPFLKRAELGPDGERLAPVVEAFGFEPIEVEVEVDEAGAAGLSLVEQDAAEIEITRVEGLLADVRARIKATNFTPKDFAESYRELVHRAPQLRRVVDALVREQRPPNAAEVTAVLSSIPETVEVLKKLLESGNRIAAELLGQDVEALDPAGRELRALQDQEKRLKDQRLQLLAKVRPEQALEEELREAQDRANKALQGGTYAQPLFDDVARIAEQIQQARRAKRYKPRRKVKEVRHVNLPRRPVPYRIEGEYVVLESLPCWLRNPAVASPRETDVIPMPVRITFGTRNYPRPNNVQLPSLPRGKVSPNAFVQAGVDWLAADRAFAPFQVDLGAVVPARPAEVPFVLTFSRTERKSGKATDPFPMRVDGTQDESLRVLYRLPDTADLTGWDNFEAVLERAQKLADAYMAQPVRDSGEVTVLGPRPVNCNGRISAVRWQSTPEGTVDTTLAFDSQYDPALDRQPPGFDQGPIVTGFDPRDPEDAA